VVFTERYLAGKIELELVPQGTLAERIRAGGAGIPAFYTPTSFGTDLAAGKPVEVFEGRSYVRERWLKADVALVKAHLGDTLGNLTYRMAARNSGPLMCMAAARTIVQVSADRRPRRHRPRGGDHPRHLRARCRAGRKPRAGRRPEPRQRPLPGDRRMKLTPTQIAWRAAQDIQDGAYVNLGIGFPEMVARFQPPGRQAIFHTENGILGFGEAPAAGSEDWDLINAGKKAVTLKPGTAFFHHADSFAMVRGGHLDVAILGAYEVAETGDLANWSTGTQGACRPWAARWTLFMAPSAWPSSPTM
jgi:acyl CoA:acetate/3-ketoacid CoA transferase